jgi:hypothetical protein
MFDPYASGVLKKDHHDRLVAGIKGFALDAGIQPHWIWTPLAETCNSPDEAEWVRRFRFHQASADMQGLCYVAKSEDAEPGSRMAAIAGALVRNFIRARVMTLHAVLDALVSHEEPAATCLLIPNFFVPRTQGGGLPDWKVSMLYDLLVGRGILGQQTVIFASSLAELGKDYGSLFSALVRNHYKIVEI